MFIVFVAHKLLHTHTKIALIDSAKMIAKHKKRKKLYAKKEKNNEKEMFLLLVCCSLSFLLELINFCCSPFFVVFFFSCVNYWLTEKMKQKIKKRKNEKLASFFTLFSTIFSVFDHISLCFIVKKFIFYISQTFLSIRVLSIIYIMIMWLMSSFI